MVLNRLMVNEKFVKRIEKLISKVINYNTSSINGKDETCVTCPCYFVEDVFYWILTLEINCLEIMILELSRNCYKLLTQFS